MKSGKRNRVNEEINASPGDDDPLAIPRPPQNIGETPAWKASQRGANRIWTNYKNVLAGSFKRMTRAEQENLVQRMCVIVTVGVSLLALLLFYGMMPRLMRVLGVPVAVFGAYWAGKQIVTPVVLGRLENVLNRE